MHICAKCERQRIAIAAYHFIAFNNCHNKPFAITQIKRWTGMIHDSTSYDTAPSNAPNSTALAIKQKGTISYAAKLEA